MRIFAFHLLNDYSGSPKVLSQLLKDWTSKNHEVHLYSGRGREGFLSNINGVNYHFYTYKFAENKWLRLYRLMMSQFQLLCKIFFRLKKGDIVYVNTVLPFGAAIAGKLRGVKVIYHIHETTMKPPVLKRFLFGIAKKTATKVIFVSHYLMEKESFSNEKEEVVYNALEQAFYEKAKKERLPKEKLSNVLMVCSLKEYKGVNQFVDLALNQPKLNFRLVVNASQSEIDLYFEGFDLSSNLSIFPVQTNLHPFYQWADLIVNFSLPEGWVETFGLTIIEGMVYGLPAIVPEVGGITELIVDGENGYKMYAKNSVGLQDVIAKLSSEENYRLLSSTALKKVDNYIESEMFNKVENILTR